jgi:hypothetical protein
MAGATMEGRETVRVLLMGMRLAWGVDEPSPRLFSIDESTIAATRILTLTPRLAALKEHSKSYLKRVSLSIRGFEEMVILTSDGIRESIVKNMTMRDSDLRNNLDM